MKDTPLPSPRDFRWRTDYRKCPRRGSKRRRILLRMPNVGAGAMATEVWGGLGGSGSHSGSHSGNEFNAAFGCPQIHSAATRNVPPWQASSEGEGAESVRLKGIDNELQRRTEREMRCLTASVCFELSLETSP